MGTAYNRIFLSKLLQLNNMYGICSNGTLCDDQILRGCRKLKLSILNFYQHDMSKWKNILLNDSLGHKN